MATEKTIISKMSVASQVVDTDVMPIVKGGTNYQAEAKSLKQYVNAVSKDDVVQTTGTSESAVMSQKAVSEAIPKVVNDLTTGGADKALSAEMGKELDGKLAELGTKVDSLDKKHFSIGGEVQTNAIIDCWFSATVTDEYAFSIINNDSNVVALKNMTTNTQKICQARNVSGIIYVPIDGVYAYIVYDMSLISSNLSTGIPVNRLAKNTKPINAESLYNMLIAEMYHDVVITRDVEGNVTTKTVRWIDGTEGIYTSLYFDTTFRIYNGYKVTYKEVYLQQDDVTRDADGNIISRPQIFFMNNGVVIN